MPQRRPPIQVTLTVQRDYPDYEFFLVEPDKVQRVALTASDPLIINSDTRTSQGVSFEVYVVPKADLVEFKQTLPPRKWFEEKTHEKYLAGYVRVRRSLDFIDNRNRIEKTFEVQFTQDSFHLVLVAENEGNRWVRLAWGGICCLLPPVAIVLAGLWFARFINRKRRAHRPPSQQ